MGASGGRVPRTVHQVWLGGEPFPPILGAFVDAAALRAHGSPERWDHRVWTEAILQRHFPLSWPELAARCCHLSQASNVARYLILQSEGGLYLDTDVEVFCMPGDLSGAWIAGTSPEHDLRQVNPCCLAAPPGHPYILRMLDAILCGEVDLSSHMAAGPIIAAGKIGPDVNIWPAHVWHGKRGDSRALGHHYGWGPRLKSFVRFGRMPPTGDAGVAK